MHRILSVRKVETIEITVILSPLIPAREVLAQPQNARHSSQALLAGVSPLPRQSFASIPDSLASRALDLVEGSRLLLFFLWVC